jgi:hypothetical protein
MEVFHRRSPSMVTIGDNLEASHDEIPGFILFFVEERLILRRLVAR